MKSVDACIVCRQVACVCPPKADWDKACHFCGQMKCGCSQQDRQGTGAGPYRQPAVVHCNKPVLNRDGVPQGLCVRQPGHKVPCGIGQEGPGAPRSAGDLAILHLGALRRLRAAERALDAAENERNSAQAAVKSAEAALRAAVEQE